MAVSSLPLSVCLGLLVVLSIRGVAGQAHVATKSGKIQGLLHTVNGKKLTTFLGVPFAKPPLGALRFMKPQPTENWTDVKNTTEFGASCVQTTIPGVPAKISEDCLTLNVFVPGQMKGNNSNGSSSNRSTKAVMVWIYGGGYNTGATNVYIFDKFAVQGDVIVVSINYRVGVFGFLSTGDVNAPGNAGLWDQIEGLKWVRDNIANFGGDPNRVTIFGESAGGASVSQLALTLAARGLFRRFISMSGSALSDWAFVTGREDTAAKLGDILNCSSSRADTAKLVACLRNADKDKLHDAGVQVAANRTDGTLTFGPVLDNDMFPRSVSETLMDDRSKVTQYFRTLDYMGGFLNSDGGGMFQDLIRHMNYTVGVDPGFVEDVFIPRMAKTISPDHHRQIAQKIQEMYFAQSGSDKAATARGLVDLYTDAAFGVSTIELISKHLHVDPMPPSSTPSSPDGSSYLYYFTKEPSFGHLLPMPNWFSGANHADEVVFMLHGQLDLSGLMNFTFDNSEKELYTHMVTYWTNFAKTGNPNQPDQVPIEWQHHTASEKNYLELGDHIESKTDLLPKRMELWLTTIPRIISRATTPSPTATSIFIYCGASPIVLITAFTLIISLKCFH